MKKVISEVKCPTCGEYTPMHQWILADPEHDFYRNDQRYVCPICAGTINLATDAVTIKREKDDTPT